MQLFQQKYVKREIQITKWLARLTDLLITGVELYIIHVWKYMTKTLYACNIEPRLPLELTSSGVDDDCNRVLYVDNRLSIG